MKIKKLFFSLLFLMASKLFSQSFLEIEKKVNNNNKNGKFEKSIEILVNFLNSKSEMPYDRYQAYILKSHTHKALFDYNKTFEALDLAYKEGIKSEKKGLVDAVIKAEKAFAYFDIQKYKESKLLMNELKKTNYKSLDLGTVSYLIMQDGYLDFLNGNYSASELKYNDAISYMKNVGTKNLPIIYAKKILLYSKMKNSTKALEAFNQGKKVASNPKSLKYLLYLNESLRTFYEENDQWQLADKTFHRVDSLRSMYNSEESVNKINLLEKDLEIQKKNNEINRSKIFKNSLLLICSFLIIGIYLSIRLYRSNKEKSLLLEKENLRIHEELKILTSSLNSQGFTKIDLSQFDLSERQIEIIELVKLGKSNKEIADIVFISENTVKYHLKIIYEVLKIENRSEFFKLIK